MSGERCYRHQRICILGFAGVRPDADLLNESGVTTLIRRDGFASGVTVPALMTRCSSLKTTPHRAGAGRHDG